MRRVLPLLVAPALLAVACRGSRSVPELRAVATAPTSAPTSSAPAPASAAPVASEPDAELPPLRVVLDDPRLAPARDRERAGDPLGAARAVGAARLAGKLTPPEECGFSYTEGRLLRAAGSLAEAAVAMERVADAKPACSLAAYASLRAAEAHARAGRNDDAIARGRAAGEEIALRDVARLAVADALVAKGDRAQAVPLWRAHLAASPRGLRWAEIAARLGAAVLDGEGGGAGPREAFDLATRALVEAPGLAVEHGAAGVRSRAAAALRAKGEAATDALDAGERAREAQGWLDAGDADQALDVAASVLGALPKAAPGAPDPLGCKVAVVRATAAARAQHHGHGAKKRVSVEAAWADAIARCEGDEGLPSALYNGAKAAASAGRAGDALARYGRLEQLFPKHRLADDARLHTAALVRDQGDEARALQLLVTLPDAYPDGDQRGEALFRAALARIAKGEADAAKAVLDRAIAIDGGDHHWSSAGRAAYFRARLSQLGGDVPDAKKRYAAIIAEHPLAYYMAQAYARLAALEPTAASAALSAAALREPSGKLFTRDHPELGAPPFRRFLALLEVGEIAAARREVADAGLTGDQADSEVLYAIGALYNRAGAPEVGHGFTRSRLTEHLAHYPVGRWRVPWEVAFPRAHDSLVQKESEARRVPTPLTWAIMREESGFNEGARSASNAIGLMQILVSTAREVARGTGLASDEAALRRPEIAIALGTKLLGSLRGSFPGNPALAIGAYNAGSGAVGRWVAAHAGTDFDLFVEQVPYDETRNYIKRVLASQAAYAFLYARPLLAEVLSLPAQVRRD